MPRQRHEARLDQPITNVFAALVDVAARGRWGAARIVLDAPQPRAGCIYAQQRGSVFRRGKVLECLRPVSMTLQETLFDPPCHVKLRLHWRLEPLESGTCVLLDARYSLNGAALLRRKHWYERIQGHCARMLGALPTQIDAAQRAAESVSKAASAPTREPALIVRKRAARHE